MADIPSLGVLSLLVTPFKDPNPSGFVNVHMVISASVPFDLQNGNFFDETEADVQIDTSKIESEIQADIATGAANFFNTQCGSAYTPSQVVRIY